MPDTPADLSSKRFEDFMDIIKDAAQDKGLALHSNELELDPGHYVGVYVFDKNRLNTYKGSLLQNRLLTEIDETMGKKLGPYRKKHELPFPELPRNAEANLRTPRKTQTFSARIDPTIIDAVKSFNEESGKPMREIFEHAFAMYLAAQGINLENDPEPDTDPHTETDAELGPS